MDFWGDALGLIILGDGRTRALLQYLSPLLHYSPPSLLHLSPATVCSSRAVSNEWVKSTSLWLGVTTSSRRLLFYRNFSYKFTQP